MSYIKVDHSKFEKAASEVDSYVGTLKTKMQSANSEVNNLSQSWQGSDYNVFAKEWDKVDNEDSTYTKMVKALESYSKYLRYAASKYKTAQQEALKRANNLPRY